MIKLLEVGRPILNLDGQLFLEGAQVKRRHIFAFCQFAFNLTDKFIYPVTAPAQFF